MATKPKKIKPKKIARSEAIDEVAKNSLRAAPIVAPGSPQHFRARVRMYRQGLGDCFLVTFTRKGKRPFHILIDCGALGRDKKFMTRIVEHIRDTVQDSDPTRRARLDVVVATHEHKDHLSGFNQARQVFNDDFDFGAVWLAWTENLSKAEVKEIKSAKRRAIKKINAALSSPLTLAAELDGLREVFAFNSDDDTTDGGTIGEALEYLKLRGKDAGELQYLEPGGAPIPLDGVEDVRVYVLGPPHDVRLLKGSRVSEQMKREGVVYHLSGTSGAAMEALEAALSTASAGNGSEDDRYHPFSAEHRIAPQVGDPLQRDRLRANPYYDGIRPFIKSTYEDRKQTWRRIDTDWLSAFGQLALDLDNDTNNTSLVLAFEFVTTREVLLFVGDAQVGNWTSWSNVSFDLPDGKQISAHELLSRTVFYKVGHHCSHNATLKKGGLELMSRDDLIAFIPLDQETARSQGANGWEMPAPPLFKALRERTGQRVVLSDISEPLTSEAANAGVVATDAYIDYFLR
jgi:hypothetical protein